MILKLFERFVGPLEVCSQAHKVQMCTLKDLACTYSFYETMQDKAIRKKRKFAKIIS